MKTYKLNRQPYTLIVADIRVTQIEKVRVKRRFNSVKYTFQVFLLTLIWYFVFVLSLKPKTSMLPVKENCDVIT